MDINLALRRYKKDFRHSYTFGVFPTLELLEHMPEIASGVIIHPKGAENKGVEKIRILCNQYQIPYEVQEKAFQRIRARENDYAVGIFKKAASDLDEMTNHVVLVNPSGMGNLGTIQRTMLGFDFQDLAIIQPAADHFHPDAVRASMGALFQLRVESFYNFDEYRKKYPRQFYILMINAEENIHQVNFQSPYSLVFGNEGTGLPENFHSYGISVKIDQSDKIDSFNIAISVGISLYEASNKER